MEPESINLVFALFDCFGAILYKLLIAGLMDQVYQSDAYEALPGVLVNRGKGHLFQGNRGKMPIFRKTNTIFGMREHKKTIFRFWGTMEQSNLFQSNKETGTPPPPVEGFAYH